MLFNSLEFLIFLPIVFLLYWYPAKKSLKLQNTLLVAASYFFYGWWDWRFLFLIAFSSLIDFWVGLQLHKSTDEKKRKHLLWLSLAVNLGFLGVFKYFNFFVGSFVDAFTFLGSPIENKLFLNVILPVGISFYTFQTLSYSIDVYRRKLKPTHDLISFLAFVSFFPQLVAGPIERATHLLPQFQKDRTFDYDKSVDGMRQILWGFFKKVVIADNCAIYANDIFSNHTEYSGSTLVLGAIFFAFQIYGDFSGYSDIAIGTARLFGFSLMRNFAFPYFSRDIAEFWRRWHISLSTWFRDYLYIPLGGSRGSTGKVLINIMIIFVVSGFWHGANWTFIVWGALNGLYFIPLMLMKQNRRYVDTISKNRFFPGLREGFQILTTFALTCLAWIFFRAESVTKALDYIRSIFNRSLFAKPDVFPIATLILIIILIGIEWIQRDRQHGLEFHGKHLSRPLRWAVYYGVLLIIICYGGEQQNFIYFQF